MFNINRTTTLTLAFILPAFCCNAQSTNQKPSDPDVLISTDGEKFVGQLISSNDSSVVFKSNAAGQVSIDWSKVQELHSATKFAVLTKGVKLRGKQDATSVPQGQISVTDQQVHVSPAQPTTPQTVPVKNVAHLVDQAAFERAFRRRNFFEGWDGGATAGIAYTSSTQSSQTYTAAINLARTIPGETWVDEKRRTLFNVTEAYGEISEPGVPTTKTSILHVGFEQDWYLNPRLFLFAQALWDHNYSQGLDLQQDYGGGIGFVVFKSVKQEFDVKASVDYIKQQFAISSQNKNLIGSTFGEAYIYKLPHGIVFTETGNYLPAWNDTKAFSAVVNASLTFPAYHRFGLTIGGIDLFE